MNRTKLELEPPNPHLIPSEGAYLRLLYKYISANYSNVEPGTVKIDIGSNIPKGIYSLISGEFYQVSQHAINYTLLYFGVCDAPLISDYYSEKETGVINIKALEGANSYLQEFLTAGKFNFEFEAEKLKPLFKIFDLIICPEHFYLVINSFFNKSYANTYDVDKESFQILEAIENYKNEDIF